VSGPPLGPRPPGPPAGAGAGGDARGQGHEAIAGALAAYVLGALDRAERAEVDAHLVACARCRDEVARLAPIPGLLARVDRSDVDAPPIDVAARAAARARRELVAVQRSRGRWRLAAALVAVAAAVLGAVTLWPGGDGGPEAIPLEPASALGLESWASITPRSWGTEIAIGCDEIPDSERYTLVAVATDGRREQAAAWGPSDEYHVVVEGATSIHVEELDHIAVLDASGRELFRAS
jgi:anti-sigma factor RsiW